MPSGGRRRGAGRPAGALNKATVEVRELARAYGPAAVDELARLAFNADSETVRVAASRELLDRGYGRPTQPITGDGEASKVTFIIEGGPPLRIDNG